MAPQAAAMPNNIAAARKSAGKAVSAAPIEKPNNRFIIAKIEPIKLTGPISCSTIRLNSFTRSHLVSSNFKDISNCPMICQI